MLETRARDHARFGVSRTGMPAPRREDGPKGRPLSDLPRDRRRSPDARRPDAPQAPARGAGDRPGDRRRSGRTRPRPTAACSSSAPTPRPRTASRRRSGSRASSAPRASTTRRPSRSTRPTASPSATSTASRSCSSRPARRPSRPRPGSKAPVSIFVEETGKTGFAHLTNLAPLGRARAGQPGRRRRADPRGQPPDRDQQRHPDRHRRAARRRPPAQAHGRRQQVPRRRDLAGRPRRPAHHPRGLPGPAQLRQGLASRPPPSRRTCARTRRARSSARTRTSRTISRTTSRTRRSRTSTASCRPRRRPTRRSSRRRTSSRSRRPSRDRWDGAPGAPRFDSRAARRPGPVRLRQSGPMAGRALLLRADPGFSLPAFERFAPPPPPALVAARIEAARQPGRHRPRPVRPRRLGRPRRDRPPAQGHQPRVDAARPAPRRDRPPAARTFATSTPRSRRSPRLRAGETSLKTSITDRYASRCATCDRPVILDELTWAAERPGRRRRAAAARGPIRKHYRCPVCRDQLGGGEQRQAAARRAATSRSRSTATAPSAARAGSRDRFPVLEGGDALADELLDLHTPAPARRRSRRSSSGSRSDLRAAPDRGRPPARAPPRPRARRAGSRRAPGRVAPLRIAGRPRASRPAPPSGASATHGSRSRTASAWCAASSSGSRAAPGARSRRGSATTSGASSRASATAVVKQATPAAIGALELEAEHLARRRAAGRGSGSWSGRRRCARSPTGSPGRTTATAWVLGREAAATLPLEPLFGPAVRPSWGWQAAAIDPQPPGRRARRSRRTPGSCSCSRARARRRLVASGARRGDARATGCRGARLPEAGRDSGRRRRARAARVGRGPRWAAHPRERRRSRRCRVAPATPTSCPTSGLFAPPERIASRAVLRAGRRSGRSSTRPSTCSSCAGEPVSFDGLLGEILVGLDRAGHLRRLVRPPAARRTTAAADRRPTPTSTTSSACWPSSARRSTGAEGRRLADDRRPLVAGRPRGPGVGRRPARGPGRVGRLQPAVDRRAALRDGVPRPDRRPVHRPATCPTRPSSAPASTAIAAWRARRSGSSPRDDLTRAEPGARRADRDARRPRPPHRVPVLDRRAAAAAAGRRRPARRPARRPRGRRTAVSSGGSGARTSRTSTSSGTSAAGWCSCGRSSGRRCWASTVLRRHARMPAPTSGSSGSSSCSRSGPSSSATSWSGRRCSATSSTTASWHLLKANHLRDVGRDASEVGLADLEPLLGLDPARRADAATSSLFGG